MNAVSLFRSGCLLRLLSFLVITTIVHTSDAATTHLFVPGHGITGRTWENRDAPKTVDELLAEIDYGTSSEMKWMRIVEMSYKWIDLESSAGSYSVDQIVQDAANCGSKGKYLRVILLHKDREIYFPSFMRNTTYTEFINTDSQGYANRIIKLDQDAGLTRLKNLYKAVIAALKNNAQARKGFYGFVLQETAISADSNTYYGRNTQVGIDRQTAFFGNLRVFHLWLSQNGRLKDFDTLEPRGRLFWQMINSPKADVDDIVADMPAGGGLCGPDTFPREPSAFPALYEAYCHMRQRTDMPVSLHVYHTNYKDDRPPSSGSNPGVQPIWADTNLPSISCVEGLHNPCIGNLDAGDGIANFLGCVTTGNAGDRPDNLNVNNVIWSIARGQVNGTNYGWPEVKTWMNTSNNFPRGGTWGGCNGTVPTDIVQ